MNNFFANLLGKQLESDIAENPKLNPIQLALKNPMVKGMAKSYRTEILEALQSGEKELIRLISSIELKPGETQIAPVLDIDQDADGNDEIRLLVVAFQDGEITRVISDTPLRKFLTEWFLTQIK